MTVSTISSEPQLLRAAARAASLDDRLVHAPDVAATDPRVVDARLTAWCDHAADGDGARFRRYLDDTGLRLEDAQRLVHDVAAPDPEDAPAWLDTLDDVVRRARDGDVAGDADRVAFGDIWLAAGATAQQRLRSRLSADQRSLLGPSTTDQLVDQLLDELAMLGAPTLYERFSSLRRQLRVEGSARDAYVRFVDFERAAGLPTLVTSHPVLGRLVAQRVDELVAACAELIERLHGDLPHIVDRLGGGVDPGPVTAITLGRSDRHRGGRTVGRVDFAGGLTLAYKPKPLDGELALAALAAAAAGAGLAPPVAPHVLNAHDYGWAAWIDQRPCADPSEVERYFEAAGTVLALTSVVGGTDLLVSNVVAAGTGPAIVDAEMVAAPALAAAAASRLGTAPIAADAAVLNALQSSVVDTGLLPWHVGATPAEARDTSGLTGRQLDRALSWSQPNTADMVPELGLPLLRRTVNTVTCDGVTVDPADHVDALLAGYTCAHRWFVDHTADVVEQIAASGLFDAPARFTFRATGTYEVLARRALTPELLADGLLRSLALDAVNNTSWWTTKLARLHDADPVGARRVTAAERVALERLDIPLFIARPVDRDLVTERGTVHGVFRGSPMTDLEQRLGRLDDDHLAEQLLAARGCFEARHPTGRRQHAGGAHDGDAVTQLEQAVRRIAKLISTRAVRVGGVASWLVVAENHLIRRRQLLPIGPDLYGGRSGLGVFLAAAAAHTGDADLAALAGECVRPVVEHAGAPSTTGLGGALTGSASCVYGLALVADLLDDHELAGDAEDLAAAVSVQASDEKEPNDIASGTLGAALAMAAASAHGAGAAAIGAAERLGEQALAAIETPPATTSVGMAHGLMGRALAFERLHRVTGTARFAAAADAAVEQADAALRAGAEPGGPLVASWCQGSAGGAAAALVLGDRCTSRAWQVRIEAAVEAARHAAPTSDGSACCGRAGGIELLVLAGEEAAARAGAAALTSTDDDGWPLGGQPGAAPLLLGFHRGLAGLGYTLLRALDPTRFPSVLTWS